MGSTNKVFFCCCYNFPFLYRTCDMLKYWLWWRWVGGDKATFLFQYSPGFSIECHLLWDCLHSWSHFKPWHNSPLPFKQAGILVLIPILILYTSKDFAAPKGWGGGLHSTKIALGLSSDDFFYFV